MRNAIIIHGKPTEERYNNPNLPKPHEANWLPWLGAKLEEQHMGVSIPAMPRPFYPDYEDWKNTFEALEVAPDSGLIGHSAGAEFILRWLSENKDASVEKVALVAPYKDKDGKYGDFSQYVLDSQLTQRVGRLTVFNSQDDSEPIQQNAHKLAKELQLPKTQLIELPDYGHFMVPEFPELYEEILQ